MSQDITESLGELVDSYGDVEIRRVDGELFLRYIVKPPDLLDNEITVINNAKEIMDDYKDVLARLDTFRTYSEKEKFLQEYLRTKLEYRDISFDHLNSIISIIIDNLFFGYGRIGPLIRDGNLEEIMINGVGIPVFVFHRKYGNCKTNIVYENYDQINELISWISKHTGRRIDRDSPLLDGHMPDGSRVNIAIAPAVPRGPSITIRKFKKTILNIIDLISMGTISLDIAAFLWVCIEGLGMAPSNILIAGGTGSGKTTLFNALAMFINPTERIITVEDTLELNLEFLENWIAMEAKPSVLGKSMISMHALLQNALRMRPDRVLVGEVRGEEAETLFVAMDIGLNGSMGTIHANTAREAIIRITNEPMSVPIRMLELIDLIIVMNRHIHKEKGIIRRVTSISEIVGIVKETPQIGEIYLWDKKTDKIGRTKYPVLLKDKIAERCGLTRKHIDAEIYVRKKILEYMLMNDIRDNRDILRIFHQYYINKESVMKKILSKKDIIMLNKHFRD